MRKTIVAAAMLALAAGSGPAVAETPVTKANADELKAEIKARCQDSMQDYGDRMVLECMKQDWQAVKQIPEYKESHPNVSERCISQMRDYGFRMVLECIRQDAQAQEQIDDW